MAHETNIQPPSFDEFEEVPRERAPIRESVSEESEASSATTIARDIIFTDAWATTFSISMVLSLVLAVATVYALMRYRQIRKDEYRMFAQQPLSSTARATFGETHGNTSHESVADARWRGVLMHMNAENENDWRRAILEADVMLDDAITRKGYTGEGLGEKLKQIDRSELNAIDDAWEAHKVRNRIAHEGGEFQLAQRDVRRAIAMYERVFKELGYIAPQES